mgnify:CR=1 FL=1
MPTDVAIGAGYIGDQLFSSFPGQYRDTVQGPNSQAQPAAQTFVVQTRTDPDHGRPMALMDMPGVGKVMVPADQVQPQRTCFLLPEPSLDGLDRLDDLGKMKHGAQALGQTAGHAAQEAVRALASGALKSWADIEAHVKRTVEAARARIEATIRSRIAKLPAIAAQAVAHALSVVRPHADAILKGRGMGCSPRQSCGAGGMGDFSFTEAFASLVYGKELDQLSSALGKVQNQIMGATNSLGELEQGKAQADALLAEPGMFMVLPMAGRIPLPAAIEGLKALKGVDEGYKAATGLNYMTDILVKVFGANIAKLRSVYPAIDSVMVVLQNWDRTYVERVARIQKYSTLWDHIQNEHNRLMGAVGGKGGDWNDPRYVKLASLAVQNVTGVAVPEQSGVSGMGDLGAEPVSTAAAIIALVVLILKVVAIIAVVVGLVVVVREFNAAGRAALDMRRDYEARKEAERKTYIESRTAELAQTGDPAATRTATKEWDTKKATDDVAQKVKEQGVTEKYATTDLGKYIPWAAGIFAAVTILPKVVGIGDIGDLIAGLFG